VSSQMGFPHFNSYHHNNGLLFQFILSEFLEAFSEMEQIKTLAEKIAKEEKKSLHEGTGRQILIVLYGYTAKLAGSTPNFMRLFSWNLDNGLLAKLRNYCVFFSHNANLQDKESILLQRNANRIWETCLACLDFMQSLLNQSSKVNVLEQKKVLNLLIEKMMRCMRHFANLLAKIMVNFRDEENVMFFLLRHHQEFDRCYGSQFIAKFFNKMFPKGLIESQQFLSERYTNRGFENLVPLIVMKMAQLSGKKK